MSENKSNVGIVSAQSLVDVVKRENEMFAASMHQDAHEFLNFLINNVLDTADMFCRSKDLPNCGFRDLFEGLLTSETKCLACENVSTRDEPFLDLSIDLQQNTSITHCLRNFSQIEMLSESNKFFCENCHGLQEAAKTIKVKKSPKILALHLKRFKYSETLGRMVKLFSRVEYNKTLRIFNTTADSKDQDQLYELYAVVVHIGGGPYHGHYVSLIKTAKYGWLLFDDETVEAIDDNFVYRFYGDGPGISTAYLLFYRLVEDEASFMEKNLYSGLDDDECDLNSNLSNLNSSSGAGVGVGVNHQHSSNGLAKALSNSTVVSSDSCKVNPNLNGTPIPTPTATPTRTPVPTSTTNTPTQRPTSPSASATQPQPQSQSKSQRQASPLSLQTSPSTQPQTTANGHHIAALRHLSSSSHDNIHANGNGSHSNVSVNSHNQNSVAGSGSHHSLLHKTISRGSSLLGGGGNNDGNGGGSGSRNASGVGLGGLSSVGSLPSNGVVSEEAELEDEKNEKEKEKEKGKSKSMFGIKKSRFGFKKSKN
ncbi:unnamed protein product [Ambrosiozyma monospora]|uniref:Unnamed protein product n=1 Tax=Ambrosiozyma monospora TaxID=43982 RepID=A0ACB5STF0_AMBMO|nr:unnamed protein product [Ambrosiozyma monospora]